MSDIAGAGQMAIAGAMVTVAVINTVAALEIAHDQLSLAKDYYNLAKEMRDFWNNTYRPCEVNAVNEACSAPVYTPQYQTTAGRYVASVRQQYRGAVDNATRAVGRYCTGLSQIMVRDISIAEAAAVGNAMNFAYRYEEARKLALDDVRWSRRHSILGLGRGMLNEALSYGNAAANMNATIGAQAQKSAGEAMAMLGRLGGSGGSAATNKQGSAGATQFDALNSSSYSPALNNVDPYRIVQGSTQSAAGMSTSSDTGIMPGNTSYDMGAGGTGYGGSAWGSSSSSVGSDSSGDGQASWSPVSGGEG